MLAFIEHVNPLLQAALYLAILSFFSMLVSIISIVKKKRLLTAVFGFCVFLTAAVSMYLLHMSLVDSGKPSSFLGTVFGLWGQSRPIVPIIYSVFIILGIGISVYSLIKRHISKNK